MASGPRDTEIGIGSVTRAGPTSLTALYYLKNILVALGGGSTSPTNTGYETVAASQTAQILGATGAVGDYLSGLLIIPATTSPGIVSVTDGNGTAITVFAGGGGSVTSLHPWFVPFPGKAINAVTPGWKVTTGANVSVVAYGNFT